MSKLKQVIPYIFYTLLATEVGTPAENIGPNHSIFHRVYW